MKTVSVIIPVYFEEGSIHKLFAALRKSEADLLTIDVALELIFVDDGSKDNTLNALIEFKKERPLTKIVKLTRNFGAINASKTGLKFVTGDCFTIIAADLQDPPELIKTMVEAWLQGAKYVVALRNKKRADPMLTRFYAALYYRLIKAFVVKDFPKGGFDIALWDKDLLQYIRDCSKNINRSLYAHWLGYTPVVLRYDRPQRAHGKSKWTFAKKFNLFMDSFLGFSILPIRLISAIGMCVSFLSFIYGIIIIIGAISGTLAVQGFATIVALVSFLLGLVIIMLGVIGEYIWRIFDEVNQRPEAVIESVY